MLVVLTALSGGAPGRRIQLRTDQVLKVGRSGWADFSVEDDSTMLDEHFEVRCAVEGCVVRAFSADAETLVNGEAVASAVVYDGDEIEAGATKFKLTIQGGPARPVADDEETASNQDEDQSPPAAAVAAAGAAVGLVGLCALLELGDEVEPLAEAAASSDQLIEQLASEEKFQDAIKLRAYLLEKRQAVWWGVGCLREDLDQPLSEAEAAAVDAAAAWVAEPEEAQRRDAEKHAAKLKYAGAGAMLALSAFWSDGSLAPEGSPDVEPDERLTAQGITASLVTAAYSGDPTRSSEKFTAFLDRGQRVASGEIPLPE